MHNREVKNWKRKILHQIFNLIIQRWFIYDWRPAWDNNTNNYDGSVFTLNDGIEDETDSNVS